MAILPPTPPDGYAIVTYRQPEPGESYVAEPGDAAPAGTVLRRSTGLSLYSDLRIGPRWIVRLLPRAALTGYR